ncbi:unnamed protein product [Linum tenue]|uniref:MLO-like protein n=1 Tax=Linum tenue TaxID=586396 RepID=A0AAV0MHZ7_9ROSI|nr:unnamed protein product [Linum tenue]
MGDGGERSVEGTPTWAVATVCFFIILISIAFEHLIHLISKNLTKKRSRALLRSLGKIKSEMMLLGLSSLFLAVSERWIASICIPHKLSQTFLPCGFPTGSSSVEDEELICANQGKVSLLSRQGVQQLNYLMFVLASFHATSSILIFSLGMAKVIRIIKDSTFLVITAVILTSALSGGLESDINQNGTELESLSILLNVFPHVDGWTVILADEQTCVLRQFVGSVTKVDYLTLRHGFIMAHFEQEIDFHFQKFIKRALESDFRVVVGKRLWILTFSVLSIFFNAHDFHSFLWLPFIPLVMLLVVGTKLQDIITSLCIDSQGKSQVVRGTVLVRPSDRFFWFGSPKFLLHLIHFILFQNSFQLAFFTWTTKKFGPRSCFHRETENISIRVLIGVLVHFLGGYVTLPLYALVTQMGTSMRKSVFPAAVVIGLRRWRRRARKNLKKKRVILKSMSPLEDDSIRSSEITLETLPSFDSLDSECQEDLESVVIELRNKDEEERRELEEAVVVLVSGVNAADVAAIPEVSGRDSVDGEAR